MDDKVSIIIPCYNDVEYIEKSISSALTQDYQNIEVIVIDDGSNYRTKLKLKELESKISKLIIQENQGASVARNSGISKAKGKFILTLDSDDFFEESFCRKAVKIFNENANVKIVSCYANRFRGESNDIIRHENATIKEFLKYNNALGNAMFYKEDWETVGGYDEKMIYGYEDWEFFIRLLRSGGYSYIIPEVLFNYRLKEVSNSTIANNKKYELLKYIYLKHSDLYTENFEILIDHLLKRLEIAENSERKILNKLEYKIGYKIITPFKTIKTILKI